MTTFESYRNREPGWVLEMCRDEWRSLGGALAQVLRARLYTDDEFPFIVDGICRCGMMLGATEPFDAERCRRETAAIWTRIEREFEEKSRG